MPLLIIQILQLQVQGVDLLARLGRRLLGLAHAKDGAAVQAADLGEVGVEELLLLRELELGFARWWGVRGERVCVQEVEQGDALLAREVGGGEDGSEEGVGDY